MAARPGRRSAGASSLHVGRRTRSRTAPSSADRMESPHSTKAEPILEADHAGSQRVVERTRARRRRRGMDGSSSARAAEFRCARRVARAGPAARPAARRRRGRTAPDGVRREQTVRGASRRRGCARCAATRVLSRDPATELVCESVHGDLLFRRGGERTRFQVRTRGVAFGDLLRFTFPLLELDRFDWDEVDHPDLRLRLAAVPTSHREKRVSRCSARSIHASARSSPSRPTDRREGPTAERRAGAGRMGRDRSRVGCTRCTR